MSFCFFCFDDENYKMAGMKDFILVGVLTGFIFCTAPVQAAIKVHCSGEGPLVYLIGGGPAFTTWNLETIQQQLKNNYRVCRWDMRGVGDNAGLAIKPDQSALSQWLHDMQATLPPGPVVLWGHSWGALQVLLFARQYPQRVSKLILSNPVDPGLHSLELIEQKRFVHHDAEPRLTIDDIDTPAESLYIYQSKIASYFVDAEQGWAYAKQFNKNDSNSRLNIRIWDEYPAVALTPDDMKRLAKKISGVIYCEDDVLQPENYSEYKKLLPQPDKHHVLKDCAHFPWVENSHDYFDVLSTLISK
jgi:pimeloyl-ACP methyl ester carboxylesterase